MIRRRPVAPAWLSRLAEVPYATEAALVLVAVAVLYSLPSGVGRLDLVAGSVLAAPIVLAGLGIVLVYRANRFINVAQLQLALSAGVLFDGFARGEVFLRVSRGACGCIAVLPGHTALTINFILSALVVIVAAALTSVIIYGPMLRLARYGPLMLTVGSVIVAQILVASESKLHDQLVPKSLIGRGLLPAHLIPPVTSSVTIAGFPLGLGDLLLVGLTVAAVVALGVYVRRSRSGVAIRAAAENPARARTLGVNVELQGARVWLIAGVLAGIAGVLGAYDGATTPTGTTSDSGVNVEGLTLVLIAVVAARFTNFWIVGVAGLLIGVASSAVSSSYGAQTPLDVAAVVIVAILLVSQREARSGRGDREDFSVAGLSRELRPVPDVLRGLDVVRRARRYLAVGGAVLFLGAPFALSTSKTTLLGDAFAFALIGLSILVLSGWAGQPALGQFGFAAIGAWAAVASGAPFLVGLLFAAGAGGVAALLLGLPALRLRGLSQAVSSLAFAVSASALFLDPRYLGSLLPAVVRTPSLPFFPLSTPTRLYFVTLVALVLGCVVVVGLRRSRTGRVLIALRSNEPAAQAFGISPLRARLGAFVTSGALAGVAGALIAANLGSVAPVQFDPSQSLTIFLYTVIGGLGGVPGPLLGAFFLWLISAFSTNPIVTYVGQGTGALLLLMFFPGGLAQVVWNARDAALRRIAFRRRISVPSLLGDGQDELVAGRLPLADQAPARDAVAGVALPFRYRPAGQWALDRLSDDGARGERVGG
jgi:branched-chain amino acid transport system permease protein